MNHSRHGFAGLLLRHIRARKLQMMLVATLVAAMSFLASAGPRALDMLLTDALHHDLGKLDKTSLDLAADDQGSPSPALGADNWFQLHRILAKERDRLPETVRKIAGPAAFTVVFAEQPTKVVSPARKTPTTILVLGIDPLLEKHVRMVEGSAPAPVTKPLLEHDSAPVEMVLSKAVAEAINWHVGDIRQIPGPTSTQQLVRLSGIYEPIDPKGDFWIHTSAAATPVIVDDGFTKKVTATAWIDPGSWANVLPISAGSHTVAWIPLAPDALRSSDSTSAAAQLSEFTRLGVTLPPDDEASVRYGRYSVYPLQALSFSTSLTNTLLDASRDDVSTTALAMMLALGPLLAGGCAIFLAAGLLRSSQRASARLAWARGASDSQIRAGLAAQGLLAGVPAALAGAGVAALLVPGRPGLLGVVLPILVALMPAAALAAMPLATQRRVMTSGATRRVAELLVLGLAAAAIVALRQRGLSTGSARVDVLLTATPVLLSIVGCVIALRLVKPVASAVRAWRARRRGLVGLVGSARAAGEPTVGLAVALALVSGVAVAVFSATTVATLDRGTGDTAQGAAGADLRVSSKSLTATSAADVAKLSGVDAVADMSRRPSIRVAADSATTNAALIATDAEDLRRVQSGIPRAPGIPAALSAIPSAGEPIPVVMSRELERRLEGDDAEIAGIPIKVVGTSDAELPFANNSKWILADHEVLAAHNLDVSVTSGLLVDAAAGETSRVRDLIAATLKDAEISTPASERKALEQDPRLSGVRLVSIAATATAALLVALAVAMALLSGAEGRARDVAVARALGMRPRGSRWLPVWEVGPLALVSVAVGVLVGILTPIIALAATDLVPFAGGIDQPSLVFQPWWTIALLVTVLVLTVLGSLASVGVAARRDLAASLRMMED